jgi:hypothetical protein
MNRSKFKAKAGGYGGEHSPARQWGPKHNEDRAKPEQQQENKISFSLSAVPFY